MVSLPVPAADGRLVMVEEPWLRSAGRVLALMAVGLLLAVVLGPVAAGSGRLWMLGGAAGAAAAAAAATLWRCRVDIDARAEEVRTVRGLAPFARARAVRLEPGAHLSIFPHHGGSGSRVPAASVALVSGGKCVRLTRCEDMETALAAGRPMAERVGLPLSAGDIGAAPSKVLGRGLTMAVVWLGIGAAAVVVLWPVVSGARPLRTARGPAPHGGYISEEYETAMRAYWYRDYRAAEAGFRAVLRSRPAAVDAANLLAYALAEQGKLDEALAMARAAMERAPANGTIIDTVGEMHERRGELREAVPFYRKALRCTPEPLAAETHVKLGRTLMGLGEHARAEHHLRKAAQIGGSTRWGYLARALLVELKPDAPLPPPPDSAGGPGPGWPPRPDWRPGWRPGPGAGRQREPMRAPPAPSD